MFEWFRAKVIGGDSGKREASWFLFLIWLASAVATAVLDVSGVEAAFAKEMVRFAGAPIFGWLGIAHGMHWFSGQMKRKGATDG